MLCPLGLMYVSIASLAVFCCKLNVVFATNGLKWLKWLLERWNQLQFTSTIHSQKSTDWYFFNSHGKERKQFNCHSSKYIWTIDMSHMQLIAILSIQYIGWIEHLNYFTIPLFFLHAMHERLFPCGYCILKCPSGCFVKRERERKRFASSSMHLT